MKNQSSTIRNPEDQVGFVQKDFYRERRQIEMKRRFSLLQQKRAQLERELQTIKTLLISLDKQMQCSADYEQLSINH